MTSSRHPHKKGSERFRGSTRKFGQVTGRVTSTRHPHHSNVTQRWNVKGGDEYSTPPHKPAMAENTRITRSTRGRGNDDAQTDAQFWNSVPDPTEIERGRTEAIDMAYAAAANFTRDDTSNQQEPTTEIGNINEVTNYTASTIPQATAPLTYMNEEGYEGLEEQFLTEDECHR